MDASEPRPAIINDSGNVILTGRIDIIKRGGENISPVEIEGLVITHPDVQAVAVIGMPDKDLSERICLCWTAYKS